MPDIRNYSLLVLVALVGVLGLSTWHYRALAKTSGLALQVQNAAVVATNRAAAQLLEQRTRERDAKQAELDKRHQAQEKTDATAVTQIAADDRRQRSAPVVVRVQQCARDAGGSGGSAQVEAPPVPTLVQQTPARPVGFFRKLVLDALQTP